jgi:hypothetical protein
MSNLPPMRHAARMTGRVPALGTALALVAALSGGSLGVPSPAAAATDYPVGYTGFHTHAEMVAEVTAIAAAHPTIVRTFSIGESHDGRELLAAKVSDNVAMDEPEPEVLFDGLTHGNEPMGLEMTLAILRWLTDGHGTDERITGIVNGRETWIVFAVNPDGQRYDYAGGTLRNWRKNRQPNAGTTAVGTDLNRNYGYRWGGSGSSSSASSSRYRGAARFSAPETRAMRDFLASRVVGGRQQIRAAISFHEYGRYVMWPYAATTTNLPSDMTAQDRDALIALARGMASRNGYRAMQASDLYVASGTTADYLYGTYRIMAFTIELSAVDYPRDTAIASETGRNRDAVLWLAERAWCPHSILGPAVRDARCGALDDDFEVVRGWSVNPDGTDTAPASGRWKRGDPAGTRISGVTGQPTSTPSGRFALVSGLPAGAGSSSYDLDGRTTVRSPAVTLPAGAGQRLTFRWLLAHGANASTADYLRAVVVTGDGTRTVAWERRGAATLVAGRWRSASVAMDAWAGQTVRIRFEAADAAGASIVEVGIDDVRITRPTS